MGTQGGNLDFALLVDGLAAEREQGITIDVAYRAFTTDKRKFIVADTPGHEQYTRNMATGASTADLAVILIDARKGVLTQTRRHTFIVHAARHPPSRRRRQQDGSDGLFARDVFDEIEADYRAFAADSWRSPTSRCIPISALAGDNVIDRSAAHAVVSRADADGAISKPCRSARLSTDKPFRLPVQWVNRPDQNFRGFSGTIAAGHREARRCGQGHALGPDHRTVTRIVTSMAISTRASPASRSP